MQIDFLRAQHSRSEHSQVSLFLKNPALIIPEEEDATLGNQINRRQAH